jgi:two-component system, NarL family, response regulator NreC
MRVVMVEDEPIFRMGLKEICRQAGGIEIVGEARDARTAFALIDRLRPDVVFMDLVLPGMDGFAAIRELRRRAEGTKILVITGRRSPRDVVEAFKAGASGYVLKSDAVEEILRAVHALEGGARYVGPNIDALARRALSGGAEVQDVLDCLSEREREVFRLLVHETSLDAIARELCISRKTLATHRHRIYAKLGCRSLAELIRFAVANRLLLDTVDAFPEVRLLTEERRPQNHAGNSLPAFEM